MGIWLPEKGTVSGTTFEVVLGQAGLDTHRDPGGDSRKAPPEGVDQGFWGGWLVSELYAQTCAGFRKQGLGLTFPVDGDLPSCSFPEVEISCLSSAFGALGFCSLWRGVLRFLSPLFWHSAGFVHFACLWPVPPLWVKTP